MMSASELLVLHYLDATCATTHLLQPKSMKTSGLVFAITANPNLLDKICFPSSGSETNTVGLAPFQYRNVSPIIIENLCVLSNAHLKKNGHINKTGFKKRHRIEIAIGENEEPHEGRYCWSWDRESNAELLSSSSLSPGGFRARICILGLRFLVS